MIIYLPKCKNKYVVKKVHMDQVYDGIRQGPEPGIDTGGYELGTGAVE